MDLKNVLIEAITNNNIRFIENFVAKGFNVNTKLQDDGLTPLMLASQNGHKSLCEFLIHKGAKIHDKDEVYKWSPIIFACFYGHYEIVKLLLEKGADVNSESVDGKTCFWFVCQNGEKEIAELLISKGARMKIRSYEGGTKYSPLFMACLHGHMELIELLLSKGLDINEQDEHGWTSFFEVCAQNFKEIAEFLIKKGANVEIETKGKQTPLLIAAQQGADDSVKLLVEHGANLNKQDEDMNTALIYAIEQHHDEIALYLCEKGADFKLKTKNNMTAFLCACRGYSARLVEYFLDKGADLNEMDSNGEGALKKALKANEPDVIDVLRNHIIKSFYELIHSTDSNVLRQKVVSSIDENNELGLLDHLVEALKTINLDKLSAKLVLLNDGKMLTYLLSYEFKEKFLQDVLNVFKDQQELISIATSKLLGYYPQLEDNLTVAQNNKVLYEHRKKYSLREITNLIDDEKLKEFVEAEPSLANKLGRALDILKGNKLLQVELSNKIAMCKELFDLINQKCSLLETVRQNK